MTRNVSDAALLLNAIAQPDIRDMTAWNSPPPDFLANLEDGVRGLRVAWSPRLGYVKELDPEVERATEKAARAFESFGAHVEAVDPGFAEPLDTLNAIWRAVSFYLSETTPPDKRALMDEGFLRVAEKGRAVTTTQYIAAMHARTELARHMMLFNQRYDLLLTPQMPTGAIEAGIVTPKDGRFGDEWIGWSPYTYPFNLTQQPAASVPCGFTSDGLPIALQIVGPARQDAMVLRAARAYERAHPFKMLDAPVA
jgi:aspartyl-tRNA(Asn)/glutamyl-tRNA(Gln) amidotransferase subunit A